MINEMSFKNLSHREKQQKGKRKEHAVHISEN